MARCIYSLTEFEKSDGEHILQNFLGARWTSDQLVRNDLQSTFGRTIDSALEHGLRLIRNLLGTPGGRGDEGPTLKGLSVSTGEFLDFEPGARPRLNRPTIWEEPMDTGQVRIRAKVANEEQFNWMLAEVRRRYPKADVNTEQVAQSSEMSAEFIDGYVNMQLDLGGDGYFRGMLKSCFNLLGANYRNTVYDSSCDEIREFIKDGVGTSERFVRYISNQNRLTIPRHGTSDQAIFIVTRGQSVEGVIQFFGEILHSFQITDCYNGPELQCGYVVDPFRESEPAEQRNPVFLKDAIPVFAEQSPIYDEAAQAAFQAQLARIFDIYYERARRRLIEETLLEAIKENPGEFITEKIINEFAQRAAHRLMRLPTRLNNNPLKKPR